MDAIFLIELENKNLLRIDSRAVEPMHLAGYPIVKMWLDGKFTQERVEPNEDFYDGFIQKSYYGTEMTQEQEGE